MEGVREVLLFAESLAHAGNVVKRNPGGSIVADDGAPSLEAGALKRSLHGGVVLMRVRSHVVVLGAEKGEHGRPDPTALLCTGQSVHHPVGLVVEPLLAVYGGVGPVRPGHYAHAGNGAKALVEDPKPAILEVPLGMGQAWVAARPLGEVSRRAHEASRRIVDSHDGAQVLLASQPNRLAAMVGVLH